MMTQSFARPPRSLSSISGATEVDWTLGPDCYCALAGDAALTFVDPPYPCSLTLTVTQTAGGNTIDWSGVTLSGSAPVLVPDSLATTVINLRWDSLSYNV